MNVPDYVKHDESSADDHSLFDLLIHGFSLSWKDTTYKCGEGQFLDRKAQPVLPLGWVTYSACTMGTTMGTTYRTVALWYDGIQGKGSRRSGCW